MEYLVEVPNFKPGKYMMQISTNTKSHLGVIQAKRLITITPKPKAELQKQTGTL